MTDCATVSPRLDEYLDATLPPPDRAEVASHLAGCATCRAELAAIAAIATAARALPRAIEPEEELWGGIAARLTPRPAWRLDLPVRRRWLQLAAALVLFVAGFAAARAWGPAPAGGALAERRAEYEATSAGLARALTENAGALAPETRLVVERNLTIIDQAIAEAEAALAADPGNPSLERMLLARYDQRLSLLRRATLAGRQAT